MIARRINVVAGDFRCPLGEIHPIRGGFFVIAFRLRASGELRRGAIALELELVQKIAQYGARLISSRDGTSHVRYSSRVDDVAQYAVRRVAVEER